MTAARARYTMRTTREKAIPRPRSYARYVVPCAAAPRLNHAGIKNHLDGAIFRRHESAAAYFFASVGGAGSRTILSIVLRCRSARPHARSFPSGSMARLTTRPPICGSMCERQRPTAHDMSAGVAHAIRNPVVLGTVAHPGSKCSQYRGLGSGALADRPGGRLGARRHGDP